MIFHLYFNVAQQFFFFLGIIVESEDDKGIPFSILPVTDDLVSFRYHFEKLQVDNALWYCICQ